MSSGTSPLVHFIRELCRRRVFRRGALYEPGRHDESCAILWRAARIDPLHPLDVPSGVPWYGVLRSPLSP